MLLLIATVCAYITAGSLMLILLGFWAMLLFAALENLAGIQFELDPGYKLYCAIPILGLAVTLPACLVWFICFVIFQTQGFTP